MSEKKNANPLQKSVCEESPINVSVILLFLSCYEYITRVTISYNSISGIIGSLTLSDEKSIITKIKNVIAIV